MTDSKPKAAPTAKAAGPVLFVSERYPSLEVFDLQVRFRDGKAEVPADVAKKLDDAKIDGVRRA